MPVPTMPRTASILTSSSNSRPPHPAGEAGLPMRIDSTHRVWMAATLTLLVLLAASFIGYSAMSPNGPRGGSVPGLVYGVAGYGLMLYAALLGMRRKVPVWRIGRAQTWMRGHLWLGFLSLPLILFHCAFTWKGSLASVLMLLLFITVGT